MDALVRPDATRRDSDEGVQVTFAPHAFWGEMYRPSAPKPTVVLSLRRQDAPSVERRGNSRLLSVHGTFSKAMFTSTVSPAFASVPCSSLLIQRWLPAWKD
jgi:hypothetical protein